MPGPSVETSPLSDPLLSSRATEQLAREHLLVLQQITASLNKAATFSELGTVVTFDIATALGATRSALVIGNELLALRGITTPDEPEAMAQALDQVPTTWLRHEEAPPTLAWFAAPMLAVLPLQGASGRVGTMMLGFPRVVAPATRALVDALARQLAGAIERARRFEHADAERVRAVAENATKDQFLAMLGHELRNPLSPILTATQLMRLRSPDAMTKERCTIERNVDHLIRLVDDLLDMSRITRGKVELSRAPIELHEIVTQAIEVAGAVIEERGHQVHVSVPAGLLIEADRVRMAQVISNLVLNAATYTTCGGTIDVIAARRGERIELVVTDTGAGIDAKLLPRIFDLFVQGPRSSARGKGGLGIGLTIARTIVELHGGTIGAQSDGPGKGSRFMVSIPEWTDPSAKAKPDVPVESLPKGQRILVVDDNEDAAWLLAEALRLLGHDVRVSHDGLRALEIAREWPPEIAFLDIGRSGMDGFALCRHLGELPDRPHCVAVTGYGQANDFERGREAGFHAHFVKPVSLREVQSAIDAYRAV